MASLIALTSLVSLLVAPSQSQLSIGTIPWGCPRFQYYNASWNPSTIPGIIEQALFEVDNYLDYLYTIEGVPSISFGIVYGDTLIHYYGTGTINNLNTNGTQTTPTQDSIYRVGSVSKVFTTLMAYILRDKGVIYFDEPVYNLNNNFSINNPWGIDTDEKTGKKITLKHLASQVSGLPREAPCTNTTSNATCYLEDTNTILDRLAKDDFYLIHPTDTQASYSNLAFALLGNIVAEYDDMTFEDALANYVIDPLGATHTGLYLTSEQSQYAATGYSSDVEQPWFDLGWEAPAGQVFSSVNDLYLLLRQYFASIPSKYSMNDNSYINNIVDNFDFLTYPTTFREMLRPVFINPDMTSGFGSPWEMQSFDNGGIKKWIRSKGGNVYGFSSSIAMIPELRLGAIALVNDDTDGSLYTFGPLEILNKAFEAWLIGKESEYQPDLPDTVSSYEGDYYYEGSYLFTIELQKFINSEWLMLYGFASSIYGTLLYYSLDESGSTFIFSDTQSNAASCWSFTLTAIDGTTFIFDIDNNGNVNGVMLIDNAYGETFTNGDSDSDRKGYYLERKDKNKYNRKVNYGNKKEIEKMNDNLSKMFRKHGPLQSPLSAMKTAKRNRNRSVRNMYNQRVGRVRTPMDGF